MLGTAQACWLQHSWHQLAAGCGVTWLLVGACAKRRSAHRAVLVTIPRGLQRNGSLGAKEQVWHTGPKEGTGSELGPNTILNLALPHTFHSAT